VIHGAATKNGAITPDRSLVGARTGLLAPDNLVVVER
jgi:hypothetical protein